MDKIIEYFKSNPVLGIILVLIAVVLIALIVVAIVTSCKNKKRNKRDQFVYANAETVQKEGAPASKRNADKKTRDAFEYPAEQEQVEFKYPAEQPQPVQTPAFEQPVQTQEFAAEQPQPVQAQEFAAEQPQPVQAQNSICENNEDDDLIIRMPFVSQISELDDTDGIQSTSDVRPNTYTPKPIYEAKAESPVPVVAYNEQERQDKIPDDASDLRVTKPAPAKNEPKPATIKKSVPVKKEEPKKVVPVKDEVRKAIAQKKEEEKKSVPVKKEEPKQAVSAKRQESKKSVPPQKQEPKKVIVVKREEDKKVTPSKKEEPKTVTSLKREEPKKTIPVKKEEPVKKATAIKEEPRKPAPVKKDEPKKIIIVRKDEPKRTATANDPKNSAIVKKLMAEPKGKTKVVVKPSENAAKAKSEPAKPAPKPQPKPAKKTKVATPPNVKIAYAGKWVVSVSGYDSDGSPSYNFELRASNGEKLLSSNDYKSLSGAKNGIKTYRSNVESNNFTIAQNKKGDYFFRLLNASGQLLATGEQYQSKANCESAIESVKRFAATAVVVVENDEE